MTGAKSEYGIAILKNIMVSVRDGVHLATDVHRPAFNGELAPGKFPAILVRTSYNKDNEYPTAEFFVPRGYVVVIQDLRGRYRSEGTGQYFHLANPKEGLDGYDTVEWIAAQPWSNGRVGTMGSSHLAIVQSIMALYRPPHLTAMWHDVAPTNIYAHCAREGGAMALHIFGALCAHARDAQEIRDDPGARWSLVEAIEHLREWVCRTPFKPGHTPLVAVPNLEKILFDYYYRGEYDEFWKQDCCDQERHFDRHADVPAVFSGGWYDPFAVAETNYFAVMSKQNKTPQRLIMGPWNHQRCGESFAYLGDVDFGPTSMWGTQGYYERHLRWFDRWLKDIPNGVEDDPPVRIFVMGGGDGRRTREGKLNHGGQWRSEYEWPLARTRYTDYYFHAGGRLSPDLPGENAPPASFVHDPANPVPTIAGNLVAPLKYILPAAAHQKEEPGIIGAKPPYLPLAVRPDVLVFQTPPLKEDVEVTGPIAVRLWISSSAVDTDFTAKLIDVYPPNEDYPAGYHLNLVDSIIRCRYRDGWEKAELMEPGQVYRVQIALPPTGNLFRAGHRIRVDVAGSNFPRFDVNPNTGEPLGRHTHTVVARNTVYLDRARPSHIALPII